MQRHRLLLWLPLLCSLLIVALASTACGDGGQATPTPTRTPKVAQADTPTPISAATATATARPSPTPSPLPSATPTAVPPTDTPTPTPEPVGLSRPPNMNPLSGELVDDPARLQRRPLFVVINNDPPARAVHYGFPQAELVYEYIMEGRAVTRFTAVYLAGEAEQIGPIRSARLINFYLTPQFGGALVASGAGQDVRWFLKHKMAAPYLDIDLDDPGNNVYSFSLGTDYRTRLQTGTALLRDWLADWDVQIDPELPGFAFSDTAPTGTPGQMASIDFPAEVVWTYDAATGRYLRSMDGEPHRDAPSGEQLAAANVVIQTMAHEATDYVEDSLGTTSIRILSAGEGQVKVLRDGVVIEGTWRAGETTMPELLDASGRPLPLKPGNSWIEIVEPAQVVTIR